MAGWKPEDLKTNEVREEGSETREESSSKRAGNELEQEPSKKQKIEDDKETKELKHCMEIISDDGDDVTIKATPLSIKSPTIVDYKIYKEGKKSYFQIIRADGKRPFIAGIADDNGYGWAIAKSLAVVGAKFLVCTSTLITKSCLLKKCRQAAIVKLVSDEVAKALAADRATRNATGAGGPGNMEGVGNA
ncbi:hypothetical protein Tco_1351197 [Tanacetum coccineum]